MNYGESDLGKIEISDIVIRDIAIHSLIEFLNMSPKDPKVKKEAKSMVNIQVEEEGDEKLVRIFARIKVKYGEPIPTYARKLQEKLKNDVENLSGLKVEEVSITVEDVVEIVEEEQVPEVKEEEKEEQIEEIETPEEENDN